MPHNIINTDIFQKYSRQSIDKHQHYNFKYEKTYKLGDQMQLSKGKVMIVEDDLEYLTLYKEILNTSFDVYTYTCAQEALEAIRSLNPQTIILDLHLPDITGIEFCQELSKQNLMYSQSEIIFISGETDIAQKLKAFEMGAADFIAKPFEISELKQKISSSIGRQLNRLQLHRPNPSNNGTFTSSKKQAPQCNQIMHFYNDVSSCSTVHKIAETFFSLMSNFGVQTSICFRLPQPTCLRDDRVRTTPIEEEVFDILKHSGRLHEFSNRLMVNEKHVSFLIKHLSDDNKNFNLIKQNACALAEAMNAKALELYNTQDKQPTEASIEEKLEELSLNISDYQTNTNKLLTAMMYKITEHFHSKNISDAQSQWLEKLTIHTIQELEVATRKIILSASNLSAETKKAHSSESSSYLGQRSKQ